MADSESTPSLAVIVPATDSPPTLGACLDAVRVAGGDRVEVIVQRTPAGAGPAAARNLAAERASAEILVFVDADIVLDPEALGLVRAAFAEQPDLVAAFGAYDRDPAAPGSVSRFRNLLHHHVHTAAAGEAETFWAGIGAVRRDRFLAAGGFDAERFPVPAVEDIELGRRLRSRGGRILLDPRITGTHLKRWSLIEMLRTDLLRRGVPWARIQLEERGLSSSLNLGLRYRLSALASLLCGGALLLRRPRLAIASLATMISLNLPFYGLLARSGGIRLVLAGIPLHLLHQLVAIAALAIALVAHAAAGFPRSDHSQVPGGTRR